MNLDDLMEVWRSQDTAPLHGVNETLTDRGAAQAWAGGLAERVRWLTIES